MNSTTQRIFALIQASGKSEYAIKKELGLANGLFTEWRAGRSNPSTEAIKTLALYFNISADYLLCLIDEPRPLSST